MMIIIDTFVEWFVIGSGVVLVLFVLFPIIPARIGVWLEERIPSPSTVNEWLKSKGL
jgi:hypothetical protein